MSHGFEIVAAHFPPRSVLVSPRPIGFGTPDVECPQSYAERVARFNCVSTRTLTRYLSAKAGRLDDCKYIGLTGNVLRFLAESTCRSELLRLDYCNFGSPLTRINSSEYFRWCSACFADDLRKGAVYRRYLWGLRAYCVCVHHRQTLSDKCPKCSSAFPRRRGWRGSPLECPKCAAYLLYSEGGSDTGGARAEEVSLSASLCLSRFVSWLSSEQPSGSHPSFAGIIEKLRELGAVNSCADLARRTGVSKGSFSSWMHETNRPQLDALVQLELATGVPVAAWLCTTALLRLNPAALARQKVNRRINWSRRKIDWNAVELSLRHAIQSGTDCSISAQCKRLGISSRALRRRLPNLCAEIATSGRKFRRAKADSTFHQIEQRISAAAQQIAQRGSYPSRRRMERESGLQLSSRRRNNAVRSIQERTAT
jgi:transcriptional regulator with XRE-family HTH domain